MDITCVTIDCHDPSKVATFWNEALGRGGVAVATDGSGAVCGPAGGGLYLEMIRVPEDTIVKNRVHLGCTAGSLDELDAEIERLLTSGPQSRGRRSSLPRWPPCTATSCCVIQRGTSSVSAAARIRHERLAPTIPPSGGAPPTADGMRARPADIDPARDIDLLENELEQRVV
jgi:hypothetical protein